MNNIGICLGGGGAKGFAHIGVLETLEKAGIKCSIVTGTSIGAFVGSAYACNALNEFKETFSKISYIDIPRLLSPTISRYGLFDVDKAISLLNELLSVKYFEDLQTKLGITCVDLISGKVVEQTTGNIVDAVRSSIAIPSLITPVFKDGCCYVDGGVLQPLPLKLTRVLGAKKIIAVSLFSKASTNNRTNNEIIQKQNNELYQSFVKKPTSMIKNMIDQFVKNYISPSELGSTIAILEQTLSLHQQTLTNNALQEIKVDIVIEPEVYDIPLLDFTKATKAIEQGRIATESMLPQIKQMIS